MNICYPDFHERVVFKANFESTKVPDVDAIWDVVRKNRELIPCDCNIVFSTTLNNDERAPTITFASLKDPLAKRSRLHVAVAFVTIDAYRWIKKNNQGIRNPVRDATDEDWHLFEQTFKKWYVTGLKKSWARCGRKLFTKEFGLAEPTLYITETIYSQAKGDVEYLAGRKVPRVQGEKGVLDRPGGAKKVGKAAKKSVSRGKKDVKKAKPRGSKQKS